MDINGGIALVFSNYLIWCGSCTSC